MPSRVYNTTRIGSHTSPDLRAQPSPMPSNGDTSASLTIVSTGPKYNSITPAPVSAIPMTVVVLRVLALHSSGFNYESAPATSPTTFSSNGEVCVLNIGSYVAACQAIPTSPPSSSGTNILCKAYADKRIMWPSLTDYIARHGRMC
jgi:hypothetical protein